MKLRRTNKHRNKINPTTEIETAVVDLDKKYLHRRDIVQIALRFVDSNIEAFRYDCLLREVDRSFTEERKQIINNILNNVRTECENAEDQDTF